MSCEGPIPSGHTIRHIKPVLNGRYRAGPDSDGASCLHVMRRGDSYTGLGFFVECVSSGMPGLPCSSLKLKPAKIRLP